MDQADELERRIEREYQRRGLFAKEDVDITQVEFTQMLDDCIGELLTCAMSGNDTVAIDVMQKVIKASKAQYTFPFGIFRSNGIPQLMCSFIKRGTGELFTSAVELSAFLSSGSCVQLYYNRIFIDKMKAVITGPPDSRLTELALICLQNIAGAEREGVMNILNNGVVEFLFEIFPNFVSLNQVEHILWMFCDILTCSDLVNEGVLEMIARVFVTVIELPNVSNEHSKALLGLRQIVLNWPSLVTRILSPEHVTRIFALASCEFENLASSAVFLVEELAFSDFAPLFGSLITWEWFLSTYAKGPEMVKVFLCSLMCTCIEKLGNGAQAVSSGMIALVIDSVASMLFASKMRILSRIGTTIAASSDVATFLCNRKFFDLLDSIFVTDDIAITEMILRIYTMLFDILITNGQRDPDILDQGILIENLDSILDDTALAPLRQRIAAQIETLFP